MSIRKTFDGCVVVGLLLFRRGGGGFGAGGGCVGGGGALVKLCVKFVYAGGCFLFNWDLNCEKVRVYLSFPPTFSKVRAVRLHGVYVVSLSFDCAVFGNTRKPSGFKYRWQRIQYIYQEAEGHFFGSK